MRMKNLYIFIFIISTTYAADSGNSLNVEQPHPARRVWSNVIRYLDNVSAQRRQPDPKLMQDSSHALSIVAEMASSPFL